MREIEIKAHIKDMSMIIDRLTKDGVVVSEPVTQHDRVYGLPGENGGDSNQLPWLRIRTETKSGITKHIFTLKKSVTNQLDSIEHETEVADADELESIILNMGYEPYSDLTKTRRKATVGDIELCIDDVGELGQFVEAEKLAAQDVDYDAVISELRALMGTYGIQQADEVTDGYDIMQRRQKGLPVD